jgi:hypothetical protein
MTTTAPDLSQSAPRSGREMLGEFAWLARLADKVRAEHAGTLGEYVAYCSLSMGFLDRCGITRDQFDELIAQGASDQQLLAYFGRHVSSQQRSAANTFVLDENRADLEEQDAEEGRA